MEDKLSRPGLGGQIEGVDYVHDGENGLIPMPNKSRTPQRVVEICQQQRAPGWNAIEHLRNEMLSSAEPTDTSPQPLVD